MISATDRFLRGVMKHIPLLPNVEGYTKPNSFNIETPKIIILSAVQLSLSEQSFQMTEDEYAASKPHNYSEI
ncbi:hypothetical protein Lal_00034081 [Lupinus albus]|nr:hypothetical protein Lal_00034081 [Lupinus albus]